MLQKHVQQQSGVNSDLFNWNVHVCVSICACTGEENYKRN